MIKMEIDENSDPFGWVDNRLSFNNVQLSEVFKEIEYWFGVNLSSEIETDKMGSFTAKFKNPTLNELLLTVCSVYKLNYSKNGNEITIKK